MDYYYYDQDNEVEDNEDYDYESVIFKEETLKEVYQGCIKSSTIQVQHYIVILLGCGLLQRLLWELVKRILTMGNKYTIVIYHVISVICGLISLWFYVGNNSIYVFLHVINLCAFLWLMVTMAKVRNTGAWICMYTIVCQLLFECILETVHYESIRGPQMVVSMKLISVAFEIQDDKEKFEFIAFLGYLLSPSSLILGPWVSFKDYRTDFNMKLRKLQHIMGIAINIIMSIVFLNLSNCLIPWLKQFMNPGLIMETYFDAFSVRCSHYFVCYLSQATLMTSSSSNTIKSSSSFTYPVAASQQIVKPLAIEFPRSLSNVIRNWNIPMHLWLKRNVLKRLLSTKQCPYIMAIFLTYLVSCLLHGLNYKVHLVLISLAFFSYSENLLRRCLAQIFDACIEASACKTNCKYLYCPRSFGGSFYNPAILLVRLINFIFSLLVVLELAYLGVMLNSSSANSDKYHGITQILNVWSNMNYLGHGLGLLMFVFYKCI